MSGITYRGIAERSIFAVALIAMTTILAVNAAQATNYSVGTLTDDNADPNCSLRDAINAANGSLTSGSGCTNTAGNGTALAPDTITFSVTGPIMLSNPLPTITDSNLTIAGPTTSPGITIDGENDFEVLQTSMTTTVYLDNLTIADGSDPNQNGTGGGIDNNGTLTLLNSAFYHNAAFSGGAIGNHGILTVVNSTFYDNFISGSGTSGGAIDNDGTLTLLNCTFYDNVATGVGGAIINNTGSTTIQNTILVGNSASAANNCAINSGTITDGGYNVTDDGSSFTCGFSNHYIQVSSASDVLDTTDKLTNNGGPTETIADLGPAVDAIPVAQCTYPSLNVNPCANPLVVSSSASSDPLTCDQRGEPRPGSGETECDVGAYEAQLATPFATFQAALAVDLPDTFLLVGAFTPAASAAIDPVTQAGTLTLSWDGGSQSESLSIPTGSFTFKKALDLYEFNGKIGDVDVTALITSPFKNSYAFAIGASGLELTGITNPVGVTLQIGSNTGSASIKALTL